MGSVGRFETPADRWPALPPEDRLAFALEENAILKGQLAATVEFYRSLPECRRESRCVAGVPLRFRTSNAADPRDREIADLRSELAATRRKLAVSGATARTPDAAESWARDVPEPLSGRGPAGPDGAAAEEGPQGRGARGLGTAVTTAPRDRGGLGGGAAEGGGLERSPRPERHLVKALVDRRACMWRKDCRRSAFDVMGRDECARCWTEWAARRAEAADG